MSNFTKIIYVTTARLPTEKAHGLATVKLAEALADFGCELEIISPRAFGNSSEDIFDYYGIKRNFKITKILAINIFPWGVLRPISYWLYFLSFSLTAAFYVFFNRKRDFEKTVFFSHDYLSLYFLSFLPVNIFYDIHHFPGKSFFYKRVLKKAFGFAVQTKWKIKALKEKFDIDAEKIIWWPNGTDIDKFKIPLSKEEARAKLTLPQDKKIILYIGSLLPWKGVDTLIKSVDFIRDDFCIYIVGGSPQDIQVQKKTIPQATDKRVIFIPSQPHEAMPVWLKAADVLVLPNTGKKKVSLYYTSPMKLFEYMASGTPIVASRIPSILEILNDNNSFLADPDSPESFAQSIAYAIGHPDKASIMGRQAENDVKDYTWEMRARKITTHIKDFLKNV